MTTDELSQVLLDIANGRVTVLGALMLAEADGYTDGYAQGYEDGRANHPQAL